MGKAGKKAHAKKISSKYNQRERERQSALKKEFRELKGKYFKGIFSCVLCRHTRSVGYVYTLDDKEYEVCKFCNDALFNKKPYVKIVYTPMGNKR